MFILKCINCGNTFKAENVAQGELISCPICEAGYKIIIEKGKITLKESIYENDESKDNFFS